MPNRARLFAIGAVMLPLLLFAMSCGGDDEKQEIVIVELNWDSAMIQTHIVANVIEHGLGYPVSTVPGDTAKLFPAIQSGSAHVAMEAWTDNAEEAYNKALEDGYLTRVGDSLRDNWQGWVVPQYVRDANPGLISVTDIPAHKELFATRATGDKARFVTCLVGWGCEQINADKLESYDLLADVEPIQPGSQEAMFADLESAYLREEPWLGYMWNPSPPAAEYDLYVLQEPEYSHDCWETTKACAYPRVDVAVVVATTLLDDAPDVVDFLRNYEFSSEDLRPVLQWMSAQQEDAQAGAEYFLTNFREKWAPAVGDEVADRVTDALAG